MKSEKKKCNLKYKYVFLDNEQINYDIINCAFYCKKYLFRELINS